MLKVLVIGLIAIAAVAVIVAFIEVYVIGKY